MDTNMCQQTLDEFIFIQVTSTFNQDWLIWLKPNEKNIIKRFQIICNKTIFPQIKQLNIFIIEDVLVF